jgi:Beta-1,3-glucanase
MNPRSKTSLSPDYRNPLRARAVLGLMKLLLACIILCVTSIVSAFTQSSNKGITLIIRNESKRPDDRIWIQWTGQGPSGVRGQSGGRSIQSSTYDSNTAGYQLSTFTAEPEPHSYKINGFAMDGGRMNFTLGSSGFTIPSIGYSPPANNFNDPNFTKRTDKLEAFIQDTPNDNLNMTAVDFFSIPFQVEGYNSLSPNTSMQTLTSDNGDTIVAALAAIAANPSAPPPAQPPGAPPGTVPYITSNSPYLNINSNSQGIDTPEPLTYSPVGSKGPFVRMIGNDQSMVNVFYQKSPHVDPVALANGNAIPANYLYKPFHNYLKYLDNSDPSRPHYTGTTTIAGTFNGVGAPTGNDSTNRQTYDLRPQYFPTGTIKFGTDTNSPVYTGYLSLAGTTLLMAGPHQGETRGITLRIPYAFMLDPTGIVGANAGYEVIYGSSAPKYVTTPLNDVFTWIEGDFFAGMNLGAVGSQTRITATINGHNYVNKMAGEIASQDWFSIGAALANPGEKVWRYYFDYLQKDPDFYNTWAAALYPHTDAYNFAYTDRVVGGKVAIHWDARAPKAIDTIVITILPDGPS